MFDTKKIIMSASILVTLVALGLMVKGGVYSLEATVAVAILGFFGYLLARDKQTESDFKKLNSNYDSQRECIDKLGSLLPHGSCQIELIKDPTDHKKWIDFEKSVKAFNAPWSLAHTELFPAFRKFLETEGFELNVLIFEGISDIEKNEYAQVIENIRIFKEKLAKEEVKIKGKMKIKIVAEEEIPSTTFFLSNKKGMCSSILYIYPFKGEKPMLSIILNDEKACGIMRGKFEGYWEKGEEIDVS